MMSEYKYFLLSLLFHILLFAGVVFFIFFSSKHPKNYIIKPSVGGSLSVNVVSNDHISNKNTKIVENVSQKKLKNTLDYPKDDNAIIKINKEEEKTEIIKHVKSIISSGGSGNETTEVIPVLKEGVYISCTPPIYPRSSLSVGEEGTVIIRVLLSNEGKIIEKILHKSSGFSRLDQAAMQATNLWKVNELPAKTSWIEVVINFIIR